MNASYITELEEEQRQDAYKKYQLIEPYLNGTLKLHDIARDKNVPIRTLTLWLKKYRQNGLLGLARLFPPISYKLTKSYLRTNLSFNC